jgi:hypothetical protein
LVRSAALAAIVVIAAAGTASAHVVQAFGSYSVAIGWLHEPTYVGVQNAVQVVVRDSSGDPVADIGSDALTVVVSAAGKDTAALPLLPSFDDETGLGTPGEYLAAIIPTAPGDFTFHLVGTIGDQAVDQSFTSSETTFDAVVGAGDAEFPVEVPALPDLATKLDQVDARVATARDDAGRALLVGGLLGGLGVVVGLAGVVIGLRAGRRPAA